MPGSRGRGAQDGPRGAPAPGSASDDVPPRRSRRQLASAAAAAAAAAATSPSAGPPGPPPPAPPVTGSVAGADGAPPPLPLAAAAAAAAALPAAGAPAPPPPPPPPPLDDWFADNDDDDAEYVPSGPFVESASAGLSVVNSHSVAASGLSIGFTHPHPRSTPAASAGRSGLALTAQPAAALPRTSLLPQHAPGHGPRSALAPTAPGGGVPAFGFDGAPAVGARGVDYYVPGAGGAGRTESAFATPVVTRLLHSRPRLEGFGLPPGLCNPGVFPQPFTMFGEFLHRFPTEDRTFYEARALHTSLAWIQNAHNRLIDVEERVATGVYSAADAAEAVPVARAHLHQVFALLATRYECLREARTGGGDWAHTLEAIALQPAGPGYSNPATAAIHASAASARFTAAARAHGQQLARTPTPRAPPGPPRRPGGDRQNDRGNNPRWRPGNRRDDRPDNQRRGDPGGGGGPGGGNRDQRKKRARSPGQPHPRKDGSTSA